MNHQPYEIYLLSEEPLTQGQQRELNAHLETCVECRALKWAWQAIQGELRIAPTAIPQPGFSQRWSESLNERKVRQQMGQVRKFFLVLTFLIVFSFLGAFITILATSTPGDWIAGTARMVTMTVASLISLVRIAGTWLQILPPVIPVIAWVLVSSSLVILTFFWVLLVWRFPSKGVIQL